MGVFREHRSQNRSINELVLRNLGRRRDSRIWYWRRLRQRGQLVAMVFLRILFLIS